MHPLIILLDANDCHLHKLPVLSGDPIKYGRDPSLWSKKCFQALFCFR